MISKANSKIRKPQIWEAVISLAAVITGISTSIIVYGLSPHVPMLMGVIVASIIAMKCGYTWLDIHKSLITGINNALPAIIILIIVGALIGVWVLSGVVPTLIYYGLHLLSPTIFLPAALVICAITSLATGTSWGTAGTIGIAFIAIGSGLGIPLPAVAGAVISGAYFGDKMSPLSDTTNLAPGILGVDVFKHIKHMSYTTSVSFSLTLIIEIYLGFYYGTTESNNDEYVAKMIDTLESSFNINPVLLLPPLIVLFVSYKKIPAIPGITLGVLAGALCAVGIQGASYGELVGVAFGGFSSETGVVEVDKLLSRGGINSMFFTISLVIVAMMFGGIMQHSNQLKVLADRLISKATSTGSLVTRTVCVAIVSNILLCEQYMAIMMGTLSSKDEFSKRGIAPENLSRAIEDSATVTASLVPWNASGAFKAAILGVATIAYLPFAFFCWISPLVTILFAYMGWTMTSVDKQDNDK